MALKANGIIYTGSAAAGPALEGQEIECGSIASPHTICDVEFEGNNLRCYVLDRDMNTIKGDLVNPKNGEVVEKGEITAKGITGTGVIALIETAMRNKLIVLPKIQTPDGILHLQDGVIFTNKDLIEAGRAIGALRAGHITLCAAAGIDMKNQIGEAEVLGINKVELINNREELLEICLFLRKLNPRARMIHFSARQGGENLDKFLGLLEEASRRKITLDRENSIQMPGVSAYSS